MADLSAHDKFLRGEPLSPELKALREGRDAPSFSPPKAPERRAYDDPGREFSRAERLDLKELKEMPGWQLYLRIVERTMLFHQKRAISISQDDPLTNRDQIANAWAICSIARKVAAELEAVVNAEVGLLENEQ
jgi:hypothetical protein